MTEDSQTAETPQDPEKTSLGRLFKVFARIGATGFGGAMALLSLMQEQAVERRKVATPEEFSEGVALGQLLPGPIVVDAVTHLGYCRRGWLGALVAAGALILPAFVLMLVLTPLYLKFGAIPQVSGAFRGIGGAVVAVILAAVWRMAQKSLTDVKAVLLAVGCFLVVAVLGANASLMVLLAGAVGILLFRPRKEGQ